MNGIKADWGIMLSSLVKEHQGRQVARKEQQEVLCFLCEKSRVLFSSQNIPLNWGIRSKSRYHSPGEKKRGIGSRQQPHHSSCGSPQRRCCSGKFSVVEQFFPQGILNKSFDQLFSRHIWTRSGLTLRRSSCTWTRPTLPSRPPPGCSWSTASTQVSKSSGTSKAGRALLRETWGQSPPHWSTRTKWIVIGKARSDWLRSCTPKTE